MLMTRITLPVLVVAMLTLGACRNRVMAPHAGEADPILLENYPRIVAQEGLGEYLAFAAPTVRPSGETPMRVTVPVRLRSDRESRVQYRFEFFEADGQPMQDAPQWRYMVLSSRAQHFMQGAALDTRAADWRLIVRPAR